MTDNIDIEKLEHFKHSGKTAAMKDIANIARCAMSAVSTTLNNSKNSTGVSQETRERILHVAKLINYRPNHAAKSLVSKKCMTLGICGAKSDNALGPFYEADIFSGIYSVSSKAGYDVLLLAIEDCERKFNENRIDGLIMISTHYKPEFIDNILELSDNIIAIDHSCDERIGSVLFDNTKAVELAVEHFQSLGHRKIGFAGPIHENPLPDVLLRAQAFRACYDGIVFDNNGQKIKCDSDIYCQTEGKMAAEYFLSLPQDHRPTAIIAYNDVVASEFIATCFENNIDVPSQISVIGIDNSAICNHVRPKLTSISHPMKTMGKAAAEMLIEKINTDSKHEIKNITMSPELVVRKSTAQPA